MVYGESGYETIMKMAYVKFSRNTIAYVIHFVSIYQYNMICNMWVES